MLSQKVSLIFQSISVTVTCCLPTPIVFASRGRFRWGASLTASSLSCVGQADAQRVDHALVLRTVALDHLARDGCVLDHGIAKGPVDLLVGGEGLRQATALLKLANFGAQLLVGSVRHRASSHEKTY